MGYLEILLIGIGLSMDAAAVSMTNSMVYSCQKKKLRTMPLFFGGFQLLLTLAGYLAGHLFVSVDEKFSGIIAFVILGYIGGKMIYDGFKGDDENKCERLTYKILIVQAFATAIDAFAVGVGFGVGEKSLAVNIFVAVSLIGITTFLCTVLAMFLGKKFGDALGPKAEIFGGIILVLIGLYSLLGL